MKKNVKYSLAFVFSAILTYPSFAQNSYNGPIDDLTYMSTVRVTQQVKTQIESKIKNKKTLKDTVYEKTGTGFFVNRQLPNGTYRIFLVTNKHIIGEWSITDSLIISPSIIVSFYTNTGYQNVNIPLKDDFKGVNEIVHPYPSQTIDVAVVEVTRFVESLVKGGVNIYTIPIVQLISSNRLFDYGIFTGDQVLVTGYPSGLGVSSQSKPLVKSTIISSPLTGTIDVNIQMPNRNKTISAGNLAGKIILLDGYIVGGNSGGPVFTPKRISNNLDDKVKNVNFVVGVVSSVYNNTGLALVYSTDYIKDLIYKFTN